MDLSVQPTPRLEAFSATINSNFFLWGGRGASDDLSHLNEFNSSNSAWKTKQTTGTPPTGYEFGACTSVGHIIYTYGGWKSANQDTGNLQSLNTKTQEWKLLSQEGPMKKNGCAMAAILGMLVLYGGRTRSPGDIQPGSQCVQCRDDYYTNELHVYSLKKSEYISS